jgi:uncharacterized membrane protein
MEVRNFDPSDVDQYKVMGILAYIIFFVPLIAGNYKTSEYVKFHTNQGTILWIIGFAAGIIALIPVLGWIVAPIVSLVVMVLAIMGLVSAFKTEAKPLPIIGKYTLLK